METIKKLQDYIRKYLAKENISIEQLRLGYVDNPLPIGFSSLMNLLNKNELSLKQQALLIEFFGFEYELVMYNYEF
tara:strand:- start:49 stop:276 length:228 start_codon:yes stop_codon:yes gene_type:complete